MGRTMDCYKKLGSGLPGNTDQLENGMWTFISSSLAEHCPQQIKIGKFGQIFRGKMGFLKISYQYF